MLGHRALTDTYPARRYYGSYDRFDGNKMEEYPWPFEELPTFRLHLLPHHVIYNTGRKMAEYVPAGQFINLKIALALYESVATLARMHIVLEIYRAWMSVEVPPSFIEDRPHRTVHRDDCDLVQIDDDNSSDILPGDSGSCAQRPIDCDIYFSSSSSDYDDGGGGFDEIHDKFGQIRDKLDELNDKFRKTHDKSLHARIEQWRANSSVDNHS